MKTVFEILFGFGSVKVSDEFARNLVNLMKEQNYNVDVCNFGDEGNLYNVTRFYVNISGSDFPVCFLMVYDLEVKA